MALKTGPASLGFDETYAGQDRLQYLRRGRDDLLADAVAWDETDYWHNTSSLDDI